jgi:glycosyltransferase involved in cell wall biosynthesis
MRNYFRAKSLQMGYWDSARARNTVRDLAKQLQPDIVYNQMVRTVPFVARLPFPKVMDFQDSLSLNTERRMEQSKGLWRSILHYEFKMLRSTEYNAFKIFDGLTVISEVDSEAIPHRKNGDIHIIPNGVDFEYFHPIDCEKKYDIVFCGNMRYEPNVHASRYLVDQVMPLVWKEFPNATLLLAGAYPKHKVSQLASERVTVSGYVDDIRQSYASARIFAAPMQTGSGLQNKLLEAMAMGLPCVTTPLANDSLRAEEGREILVGNSPQQIAGHIISLLRDQTMRETLAANGNAFVQNNYSWEVAGEKLEEVLQNVVSAGVSKVAYERNNRDKNG